MMIEYFKVEILPARDGMKILTVNAVYESGATFELGIITRHGSQIRYKDNRFGRLELGSPSDVSVIQQRIKDFMNSNSKRNATEIAVEKIEELFSQGNT